MSGSDVVLAWMGCVKGPRTRFLPDSIYNTLALRQRHTSQPAIQLLTVFVAWMYEISHVLQQGLNITTLNMDYGMDGPPALPAVAAGHIWNRGGLLDAWLTLLLSRLKFPILTCMTGSTVTASPQC